MSQYKELLEILLQQEETLQFKTFDNQVAWDLGVLLVEKAKAEHKCLTVDITLNGHQLFHHALKGTSPDNAEWIRRKMRVVNRFHMSSYRMGIKLKNDGVIFADKYGVDPKEYAPNGGCFPIIIKEVGYVGTITVSGLPQAEDHQLVVDVIGAYLAEHQ